MDFLQCVLSSVKWNRLGTTIWVAKVVLLTMGILSTVILFKGIVVPYSFRFIFATFPPFLVSARSWLSVPFLYIIVNFIIISIVVSSNFHSKKQASPSQTPTSPAKILVTPEHAVSERNLHCDATENIGEEAKEEQQHEETLHESALSCDELDASPPLAGFAMSCEKLDKIPQPGKSSDDHVLPDSDEKCDDMEATWRAIMEKLQKRGTWGEETKPKPPLESQVGKDDDQATWGRRELREFDSFNETGSLKRDKSMSPEELHREAEAFIQKINNQMRLQRLESEQRFMEMVNRSV